MGPDTTVRTPADWRRVWRHPGRPPRGSGSGLFSGCRDSCHQGRKAGAALPAPLVCTGRVSPRPPHLGAGIQAWDRAPALIVGVYPGAGPPRAPGRTPAEQNCPHCAAVRDPVTGLCCRLKPAAVDPAARFRPWRGVFPGAREGGQGPSCTGTGCGGCRDSGLCVPWEVLSPPPTWRGGHRIRTYEKQTHIHTHTCTRHTRSHGLAHGTSCTQRIHTRDQTKGNVLVPSSVTFL